MAHQKQFKIVAETTTSVTRLEDIFSILSHLQQ